MKINAATLQMDLPLQTSVKAQVSAFLRVVKDLRALNFCVNLHHSRRETVRRQREEETRSKMVLQTDFCSGSSPRDGFVSITAIII